METCYTSFKMMAAGLLGGKCVADMRKGVGLRSRIGDVCGDARCRFCVPREYDLRRLAAIFKRGIVNGAGRNRQLAMLSPRTLWVTDSSLLKADLPMASGWRWGD